MPSPSHLSRRVFLKRMAGGSALLWLPSCSFLERSPHSLSNQKSEKELEGLFGPIDRTLTEARQTDFSGDTSFRGHEILWSKPEFLESNKAKLNPEAEVTDVVIIGGGMSGLSTAYLLRDLSPIVLDQGPRMGGNSRGESWRGIDYSIGAAYFTEPDEGTALHRLLIEDLKVNQVCARKTADDPVLLNGTYIADFWKGKVVDYLKKVGNSEKLFPEIPFDTESARALATKYDQQNLKTHLEKANGGKLSPALETAFEHYCWSSFGGSMSEISAAAGLNFLASEFDAIYVPRGGNAAIADLFYQRLPKASLRPRSLVFDVKVNDWGVEVLYEDDSRRIRKIKAKIAIMACPKFIAARLMDGWEEERLLAMKSIKYRGYVVGNALLEGKPSKDFYDCYLLGKGNGTPREVANAVNHHGPTDVVSSHFASPRENSVVFTLYKAFPYEGARGMLFGEPLHSAKREMEEHLLRTILPGLGEKNLKLVDLRLTRWGHALPLAERGKYSDKTIENLRKPYRNRVFFVEQDNFMLPCLETAVGEALSLTPQIRKSL